MPAVSKRVISLGSLTFFVAFLLVSWCSPVQGAIKPVGNVILATGTFLAFQSDRSSRSLTRGSEFYEGDRLWTGPRTKAQIRFSDGAIMTLRADTEFRVDEYEFDSKNAKRNKSLFTLIKGGFRTITGLVSRLKPENYKVKTSYAIVGVRGTTFETVFDNALYVAAWQGTVSVTNEAGEATLGFGQDTNYARVSGSNQRPVTLLETPPQFLESVAPGFGQEYQRLLEILPSEGTLVREGFAVFGGQDSTASPLTAPMSGAGTAGIEDDTVIVDLQTGSARVLRQGAASLVDGKNLPGVSWGKWAGGPVEVQTIAGTTPVAENVFWLTMAPPSNLPTTGSLAFNLVSGAATTNHGPVNVVPGAGDMAVSGTVFFNTARVLGQIILSGPSVSTDSWNVTFDGTLSGSTFNFSSTRPPEVGGAVNGFGIDGTISGGLSGPGANTISGVFDLEQTGVPTTHAEGVFVAQ